MKCLGHKLYDQFYCLLDIRYCLGDWCQDPYNYNYNDIVEVNEKPIKRSTSKTKAILLEELKEAITKIESIENSLKEKEELLNVAKNNNLSLNKSVVQYEKDISEKDKTIASLQKKLAEVEKDLANYNKNPTNGSTRFGVLEID